VYRCNGGSHSIETIDAWSTHSIAHGLETKVQMLNLEKGEGDSCHVITIFKQPYNIVSSLISSLRETLQKCTEIFPLQFSEGEPGDD